MSNDRILKLVCGNPVDQPGSFSRFVLPFAYRAYAVEREKEDKIETGLHYGKYQPDQERLLNRRKYFTREIQSVLFDKAKWLELKGWNESCWGKHGTGKEVALTVRPGKDISVRMLPPRLVLFEWSGRKEKDLDILQTGFLLVDLWFPDPQQDQPNPTLDDLLLINDLFRYFDLPYLAHKERMDKLLGTEKQAPWKYWTSQQDPEPDADDPYSPRWTSLLTMPVNLDDNGTGQWYRLVPRELPKAAQKWFKGNSPDAGKIEHPPSCVADYLIYADNRAYVWSAALLRGGAEALQTAFRTSERRAHEFGHWVKFLNVDGPEESPSKTHKSISDFEKEWAKERTYHRWESSGTWYGFSYHSGVMLATDKNDKNEKLLFCDHFREMYFDQTILLFYLRVTLFRFSQKLSDITKLKRMGNIDQNTWFKHFVTLREEFSEFAILYQFPLLSNQQQSIEMYQIARKYFDIEDFYKEVKSEIDETHEYVELIEARKLSTAANSLADKANLIALIGIPLAAAGLMASIFGMNDLLPLSCLRVSIHCTLKETFLPQVGLSLGVGIISFIVIQWLITRNRK